MKTCELNYIDENIWYGKKVKKKHNFIKLAVILIVLIAILVYYYKVVVNQIVNISKSNVTSYISNSVNTAVVESVSNNLSYSNIVNISRDNNNDINLISIDNVKTNKICKELALNTQNKLYEYEKLGVKIPIGSLTGISIFSGIGSKLNLKIMATGSCNAKIISKFESVGINQTLHSIYCCIDCVVYIDIPFRNTEITGSTNVLLCESVLIGKVPEFYFT